MPAIEVKPPTGDLTHSPVAALQDAVSHGESATQLSNSVHAPVSGEQMLALQGLEAGPHVTRGTVFTHCISLPMSWQVKLRHGVERQTKPAGRGVAPWRLQRPLASHIISSPV